MTPATLRPNPFSWTQPPPPPQGGMPQPQPPVLSALHQLPYSEAPSPYTRSQSPDEEGSGPWGSFGGGVTPTESHFPPTSMSIDLGPPPFAPYHPTSTRTSVPVTSSPSLPTLPSNNYNNSNSSFDAPPSNSRPFNRRRADTAPSSEYPPLGPGIPSPLPTPTHSATTSVSSGATNGSGGGPGSLYASSSAGGSYPAELSSSPPPSASLRGRRGQGWEQQQEGGGGGGGLNRPFRARQGSDAAVMFGGAGGGGGNRPFRLGGTSGSGGAGAESRSRTGSDASSGGGGSGGLQRGGRAGLKVSFPVSLRLGS